MPTESPRQAEANGCLSSPHHKEEHDAVEDLFDAASAEQRRDWLEGQRTPVADRLRRYPALAADPGLAAALVFHEFLLRQELNDSPDWEDYLRQFPEYAGSLCRLREIDQLVGEELSPDAPTACPMPFLGDYENLGELGRGGMGVVYKARQRKLDRLVALKMIRAGESSSAEERRRFDDEALAVASLQHPNIVRIHELGKADGCPFFAMEYVAGPSLVSRLDGTPWEVRPAAALVEVLARAMHYAHGKGIVHRDLKPANVLFDEHDRPLVTDFGLAKRLDGQGAATQTGTAMGTPSYMSPEQVQGQNRRISPATDVYALGAVLYELLTGRPPFKAATAVETAVQVMNEEPVRPGRLRPGLPRDLETVCLKCLEKDAHKRFASAGELADDLHRFQEGKPVRVRPVGLAGRVHRWCKRRPAVAGSLTAALLIAVAALAGLLTSYHQTAEAWSREEAARRKAEDRDRRTRQILAALTRLNSQSSYQPPEARQRQNLDQLQQAAAYCVEFLSEEPGDVAIQTALADVYHRISVQHYDNWEYHRARTDPAKVLDSWSPGGNVAVAALLHRDQHGHLANALAYGAKAVDLARRLVETRPRSPEYRDILADAYYWQGRLHRHIGEGEQALAALRDACEGWQALAREHPTPYRRYQLARAQFALGEVSHDSNRVAETSRLAAANVEVLRGLLADQPTERRFRDLLSQSYCMLGEIYRKQGSHAEATAHFQLAYDLWKAWLAQRPDDAGAQWYVGGMASYLIRPDAVEPHYAEAVACFEAECKSVARLAEQEPTNLGLRRSLESRYVALLQCHEKGGQPARRAATWERYVRFLESLEHRGLGEESLRHDLSQAYADLAVYCREAGDIQGAARAGQRAFELLEARRPAGAPNLSPADVRFQWANQAWVLAHSIRRGGLPEKALELAEQSRRLFLDLVGESPRDLRFCIGLHKAYEEVARAYVRLDRPDEALGAYLSSVEAMRQVIEQEPAKLDYRLMLAGRCLSLSRHLRERGRFIEAADWLLEREKLLPADAPNLRLVSQEFTLLAAAVGKGRVELSPAEQAEQQRYLQLSARTPREIPSWVPPH